LSNSDNCSEHPGCLVYSVSIMQNVPQWERLRAAGSRSATQLQCMLPGLLPPSPLGCSDNQLQSTRVTA
jgi:hypothetical protein